MKKIEYILGNENFINTPIRAFEDEICEFLSELSSVILKNKNFFGDLYSFGFYTRAQNIKKIKLEYKDFLVGRGLCFHIAPSNVPLNFAFSYIFSLLAGNSNIVRLPTKDFEQNSIFCDLLRQILPKYPKANLRTTFVKYERDDEISEYFSSMADARMIWGGDETISKFRNLKVQPRCVDITFANRNSLTIIDSKAIEHASQSEIKKLANDFYNDTYLMDQNACSSPKLVLWLNANNDAKQRFWYFIKEVAKEKYNIADISCINKYTKLCEKAAKEEIIYFEHYENLLYRVKINKPSKCCYDVNSGFFYEYDLDNFEGILEFLDDKFQTITYFGIDAIALRDFLTNNNTRGVERIVKIGRALDINHIWDGHDIIRELSKSIKAL